MSAERRLEVLRHAPGRGWREVVADEGRVLPLLTVEPESAPRGVVLVVPAMATPARFYLPFLTWLASKGFRAVSFDFRGMEGREAVKDEPGDLDRWVADARDVLAAVSERAAGLPVTWVGHSFGGQIVGLVEHQRLASVLLVASGDAYWRHNAPALRRWLPLLWWVIAPVSTRLWGYYPGRTLRILGDLPAGVMRQWSRWARHPGYLEADHPEAPELFAQVRTRVLSLSFSDDEILSRQGTDLLMDRYRNAERVRLHFTPDELGVERVGHHGFFRAPLADLWDDLVLPWLAT